MNANARKDWFNIFGLNLAMFYQYLLCFLLCLLMVFSFYRRLVTTKSMRIPAALCWFVQMEQLKTSRIASVCNMLWN